MSHAPHPPVAPVHVRGVHASRPGTARLGSVGRGAVLVDRAAGLAVVAEASSHENPRTAERAADLVLDACAQLFRGRGAASHDELAEAWWLGEHGEEREGGGLRARRPYATLPIADRVALRERVAALLAARIPESLGDMAVLEAETASLLALPGRALLRANGDLYRKAETDRAFRAVGVSACCVLFAAGTASIAHVGGTRVSLVRDGEIDVLTEEHSARLAYEREHPDASPEELAAIPSGILSRMLGVADTVEPQRVTVPVRAGDVLLLTNGHATELFGRMELLTAVRGRGLDAAPYLADRAARQGAHVEIVAVEVLG